MIQVLSIEANDMKLAAGRQPARYRTNLVGAVQVVLHRCFANRANSVARIRFGDATLSG